MNDKPTSIAPIIISPEERQELDNAFKDKNMSPFKIDKMIRHVYGGYCIICSAIPTKIARYDMDGISLIERYCDKCISRI